MRNIILTFDDGPSKYTPKVLDILKEKKVQSIFFFLGKNVKKNPEIVKRTEKDGHIVANHGYSHNRIISPLGLNFWEVKKTQSLLLQINPKIQKIFRPPYGLLSPILKRRLAQENYQVVMFDIVGKDWEKDTTKGEITKNVLSSLKDGAIIVLHDGFGSSDTGDRSQTVEALPQIIDEARKMGFEFASPKTLLKY